MPKIMLILFILPLICCSKEKEPLPQKQTEEKLVQTEQVEQQHGSGQISERCDSSCKALRAIELKAMFDEKLKELESKYEDIFKKTVPKFIECKAKYNSMEIIFEAGTACINGLKHAINLGVPYFTKEEKTEDDAKIKNAYKKRFGVSISDSELSVIGVYYQFHQRLFAPYPEFLIARTATGVKAKYYDDEADFSIGDWLDLIRTLYINRIYEWEENYYYDVCENDRKSGFFASTCQGNGGWYIEIYYLDKDGYMDRFKSRGIYVNNLPPNWNKIADKIVDFRIKTEKKAEAKAKTVTKAK